MSILEDLIRGGQLMPARPAGLPERPVLSPAGGSQIPRPIAKPVMAAPMAQQQMQQDPEQGQGQGQAPQLRPSIAPAGTGNYLGDAFSGVAQIQPGMGALQALALGLTGAQQSKTARSDREASAAAAAEQERYNREQDRLNWDFKSRDFGLKQRSAQFSELNTESTIREREAKTEKLLKEADKRAGNFGLTPAEYVREFGDVREQVRKENQSVLDLIDDPEERQTMIDALDKVAGARFEATLKSATAPAGGAASAQSGGIRDGQTATNKQTGERMIFRNGRWEPMG